MGPLWVRMVVALLGAALVLAGCGGSTAPTSSPAGTGLGTTAGSPPGTPPGGGSTVPPITPSPEGGAPNPGGFTLLGSYTTPQGNAAHLVWSDDGSAVYLADEEGFMSAARINAADPTHPTVAAANGQQNFLWAVDQRGGLLVYQASISTNGTNTIGIDPGTFHTAWTATTGSSHAVATDGARVFVPLENLPGTLLVLNASGTQTASVQAPDGWTDVYGIAYEAGTHRLYVSSGPDASRGIPGGLYIFDVGQATPAYLGKIPEASWDIAVRGTRLWRQSGPAVETWDVSNPGAPVRLGSWTAPVVSGPGGTPVQDQFGDMAVNSSGTRLYIVYHAVTASGGNQVLDWPSGVMIFDVSGSAPQPLARQSWAVDAPYYEQPTAVALSPNNSTLAVSYWAFGVRFYNVANDAVAALGTVATTGEAHDVYVDAQGIMYVFAHDDIQIINPATGAHLQDIPFAGMVVDGGWRPFRDGAIVVPGPAATIMRLAGGGIQFSQTLPGFGNFTWSVAFDGVQYLYQADDGGRIHVDQVSVNPDGTYNVVEVGSVQVPAAGGGSNPLLGMALGGQTLWAIGPNTGVVAVDVSTPSSPKVVFRDGFTFQTNGSHAGLVIGQNRVYAGAGALGLRIYNPATFQLTGSLSGFNVNFLDTSGNTYLVVANYWYAAHPDGVYLYNIARNPDAPILVDWFPQPTGSANFRARAVGNRVYRVPLYGIDVLQVP